MNMYPVESNMELADYERANDVEYIFQRSKVVVVDLNILTPRSLIEDFLDPNSTLINERTFWFDNNTAIGGVKHAVGGLLDFGHSNLDQDDRGYLLKVTGYNSLTPSVTTALLDGALVSNQFEFPEKPSTTGCRVRMNDSEGFEITRDIYFPNQDAASE